MTRHLFAARWYRDEPKESKVHWFRPTREDGSPMQPEDEEEYWYAVSLCPITARHNISGWSGYDRTDEPVNCQMCLRRAKALA